MCVKFTIYIFQDGVLDEITEFVQEFKDSRELGLAIAWNGAMETRDEIRCNFSLQAIYANVPKLDLPATKQGYGLATNVVIADITIL